MYLLPDADKLDFEFRVIVFSFIQDAYTFTSSCHLVKVIRVQTELTPEFYLQLVIGAYLHQLNKYI